MICSSAIEAANKPGETRHYCDKCLERLGRYTDEHPSACPSVHGCSDGPGNRPTSLCFESPKPYYEMQHSLRAMEDAGRFKSQAEKDQAAKILKSLEHTKCEKRDLQKEKHPLDG
jgi:hypothetical protein